MLVGAVNFVGPLQCDTSWMTSSYQWVEMHLRAFAGTSRTRSRLEPISNDAQFCRTIELRERRGGKWKPEIAFGSACLGYAS